MRKFLLLFVSLFFMTGAFADVQLDLTTATYGQWGSDDTYVINDDGTVTFTYVAGWTGTGWQSWNDPWDLTQYKSVVVEYKDLVGGEGNEDHPWIQLFIGSDPAVGQGDWGQSGRIEFVMADNVYELDGEGNPTETVIDYSAVGQIMIQPNNPLSVTITSVTFVSDDEEDVTEPGPTTGEGSSDCLLSLNTWPYNYTYAASAGVTVSFTSHWAEYVLCNTTLDLSEYAGYEVTCSNVNGSFNVVTATEDGDYAYNSVKDGTITYTFPEDRGAVTNIEIQFGSSEDEGSCVIDGVYLVKADGTTEEIATYPGAAWGCVAAQITPITYTGAWGGPYIIYADSLEPVTFTYGNGDELVVTIKLDEPAPVGFMVEPDNETGGIAWFNLEAGETEYVVTINDDVVSEDVAYIYIKSNSDEDSDYPYTLSFSSITAEAGGTSTEPEPDGWNPPADEDNLWIEWVERYDFISDNLGQITEWWADENWNVIYDGHSEYWTHGVMDREWNITVPDGIGSQDWQGQFIIWTSIPAYADHFYNFGCKMKVDGGDSPKVCVKLTEPDRSGGTNDTNVIYDNSSDREYVADGETWYCCGNNLALSDKEDTAEGNGLKLVFDFPGTPGGTVITVTDIYLLDLTATGIEEVAPATPVAKKGIYNLAGQRVNANAKGLLIIDGKKVLVK